MDLDATLGVAQLSRMYETGAVSPVEVAKETLRRIERLDPQLNSYLTVTAELALAQARQAEAEIRGGCKRGPLHGVPYAAKDLLDTRGIRTTVGSKILADRVPNSDAAVIAKLSAAGAVLIGKTGMHEWAYGITSSNPHFGRFATRGTPSDPRRVQRGIGGRSRRRALRLLARLGHGRIDPHSGGSLRHRGSQADLRSREPRGRLPAGRHPRHSWAIRYLRGRPRPRPRGAGRRGTSPKGSPLAATLGRCRGRGARQLLLAKPGSGRGSSRPARAPSGVRRPRRGTRGSRRSRHRDLQCGPSPDPARRGERRPPAQARGTPRGLRRRRARPCSTKVSPCWRPTTWKRNAPGTGSVRTSTRCSDASTRSRCPQFQFRPRGSGISRFASKERWRTSGSQLPRNIRALNLTALPVLSVPCGFHADGLPIGLQIVGGQAAEGEVLRIGWAYEQATSWHLRTPPMAV